MNNKPFLAKLGGNTTLEALRLKLISDLPAHYTNKTVDAYVTQLSTDLGIGKTTLYTKIIKPITEEFNLRPAAKKRKKGNRTSINPTNDEIEKMIEFYQACFWPTKKAFYEALSESRLLGNRLPCKSTVYRCISRKGADAARHNSSIREDRKKQVIDHYHSGLCVDDIASLLRLSSQSIKHYLREFGISFGIEPSPQYQLDILDYYYEHGTSATIEKYKVPQSTQVRWRKKWGLLPRDNRGKNRKYLLNETFFEKINTEEKAYLLGLICADGNVYSNIISIELKREDREHLQKISSIIDSSKPIMDTIHFDKRTGVYTYGSKVSFISKNLAQQLRKYGVVENKSLILDPNLHLIPESLQRHFWRGYIDGDGSLFYNNHLLKEPLPVLDLYGTLKTCIEFKQFLTLKLDISLGGPWASNSVFRVGCQKIGESSKVATFLYEKSTIYLDRKKKIADEWHANM